LTKARRDDGKYGAADGDPFNGPGSEVAPGIADFIIGRIGAAVVWFPSRVPLYRLSK
jgi:hypothetical protein